MVSLGERWGPFCVGHGSHYASHNWSGGVMRAVQRKKETKKIKEENTNFLF